MTTLSSLVMAFSDDLNSYIDSVLSGSTPGQGVMHTKPSIHKKSIWESWSFTLAALRKSQLTELTERFFSL